MRPAVFLLFCLCLFFACGGGAESGGVIGFEDGGRDAQVGDAQFDATVLGLDDGLVVHYPFNFDVLDASGNGLHGTVIGNSLMYSAPEANQGAFFVNPTGGAAAVTVVEVPDISTQIAGSFSVVVCYSSTDDGQDNGRLVGNWSTHENSFAIDYNSAESSTADVAMRRGAVTVSTRDSLNGVVTTDGQQHCQALIFDDSENRLSEVIDGTISVSVDATDVGLLDWDGIVVGATGVGDTYGARDTIVDDFRIYDRALGNDEVGDITKLLATTL